MIEISTQTLMLSIAALAAEQELLTRRIELEPAEVDNEEHLSEHVLDIQKALGELAGIYENQRQTDTLYPSVGDLIKDVIDSL